MGFLSDSGHARAVMHAGMANLRWRGKGSQHCQRMCNPQFYISGKRPIGWDLVNHRYKISFELVHHIKAEAKWLPLCRWSFQMHSLEKKSRKEDRERTIWICSTIWFLVPMFLWITYRYIFVVHYLPILLTCFPELYRVIFLQGFH